MHFLSKKQNALFFLFWNYRHFAKLYNTNIDLIHKHNRTKVARKLKGRENEKENVK